MTQGSHDAAASTLGYLYQTQWPLIELIRRSRAEPDCRLTLELLDDVQWMQGAQPAELMQSKHHVGSTGGLGDMSVDLWRTIAVWMDASSPGEVTGPVLSLVTTAIASDGSAAFALRPETLDMAVAQAKLEHAAEHSTSAETKDSREKFLGLTPPQRAVFVSRMRVLDGSPRISDLQDELRRELYLTLPIGHEDLFLGLVWDWWFRIALSLLTREVTSVSGLQLKAAIDGLRDGFTADTLPTLVAREAFDLGTLPEYDSRIFVRQLSLVDAPSAILRTAVQDYYRSVKQSAEWIENNLVDLPEVARFKEDLRDEWEREYSWALSRLATNATDDEKRAAGRDLLQRCLDLTTTSIRPQYREAFFLRGKLHELADERVAGWHPDFHDLLDELLLETPT